MKIWIITILFVLFASVESGLVTSFQKPFAYHEESKFQGALKIRLTKILQCHSFWSLRCNNFWMHSFNNWTWCL